MYYDLCSPPLFPNNPEIFRFKVLSSKPNWLARINYWLASINPIRWFDQAFISEKDTKDSKIKPYDPKSEFLGIKINVMSFNSQFVSTEFLFLIKTLKSCRYFIIPAFFCLLLFLARSERNLIKSLRKRNQQIENGLQPNLQIEEIVLLLFKYRRAFARAGPWPGVEYCLFSNGEIRMGSAYGMGG